MDFGSASGTREDEEWGKYLYGPDEQDCGQQVDMTDNDGAKSLKLADLVSREMG